MCDDMDFDVASDAFDSSYDVTDDIETSDVDDMAEDLSNDFDSIEDISEDDFNEDIETLDLDDDLNDMEDISEDDFDDNVETLDLDDDIDSMEDIPEDDFNENIETLDLDDGLNDMEDISEDNFDENGDTLGLDDDFNDIEDIPEDNFDENVETLDLDDDFNGMEDIAGDDFEENDDISSGIIDNSGFESAEVEPLETENISADGTLDDLEMNNDQLLEEGGDLSTVDTKDYADETEIDGNLNEHDVYPTDTQEFSYDTEIQELPQMTDEELEEFVNWENNNDNGYYDIIEDIQNDSSLTDEQKDALIQPMLEELREAENAEPEYGARVKGLTYDGRDIYTSRPEDIVDETPDYFDGSDYEFESTLNGYEEQISNPGDIPEYTDIDQQEGISGINEDFSGELSEQDYDTIYEGLDEYDFHGIDCLEDTERLDASLENFTSENWENLSVDEQKEQMTDLAQYIIDVTGLEDPPKIEFYNNPEEGDYGGFNRITNTLSINEYMLYQNDEAADTVAHELWHAYQYERASNPRSKLDYMYLENFNDYITPNDDFEGYQSQLLESEARAFAQQIKDRLHSY